MITTTQPQPSFILRFREPDGVWQELPLTQTEVRIGRSPDCEVVLNSADVSRVHAILKMQAGEISVEDPGSTNGTMVNGKRIPHDEPASLQVGQVFQVAHFEVKVDLAVESVSDKTIFATAAAATTTVEQAMAFDIESLRSKEFPITEEFAYLNNAGYAPLPKRTRNKIFWAFNQYNAQPSAFVENEAMAMFGQFQGELAAFINAASPTELMVIENTSAGLNAIAQSLPLRFGDNIIINRLEYPANAYPWMSLEQDGVVIKKTSHEELGLTMEGLHENVTDRTRVVAASSVQFFSGHRTDLAAIGRYCRERNILFVVDAIQSIGHHPIDVQEMCIDVLVTSGQKSMLAAPGAGFLYVRSEVSEALRPRLATADSVSDMFFYLNYDLTPAPGAQRFMMGTPAIAEMFGLLESLSLLKELTLPVIESHTTRLASHAIERLSSAGWHVITPAGQHGPIVTFQSGLELAETEALRQSLAEQKIVVAVHRDPHGLPHMRLSVHCYNTMAEVDRLCDALGAKK